MIKFICLLALGFVVGCSSSSKKEATTDSKSSTPTAPAAAVVAPVEPKNVTQEGHGKKQKAEKKTVSVAGDVTCTSGGDVRILSTKAKGQGCELEYTKGGQANVIASQITGNEKCDEVTTRVKDKLVAAGFKCE